jgi:hypothetical protein
MSFTLTAEPYRVQFYKQGTGGVIPLEIEVAEGWKISPSDGKYGDYLLTDNKSVYFFGSYMHRVNDTNKP